MLLVTCCFILLTVLFSTLYFFQTKQ